MLDSLLWIELCIVLFSGFVHGVLGFGFPMIATPLFALVVDLKKAILYTLFPTIFTNVWSLKRDNTFSAIWRDFKLLILGILAGSFVSTNLLIVYNSPYYKLILVGVILVYLTKLHERLSISYFVKHYRLMTLFIMGVMSGFIGGIANIMVPVLIMLILELKLEKKHSIGVMNLCFIANKSLQVVMFGMHGNFDMDSGLLIALFVVISLIGFKFGVIIHDKIDDELYKKVLNYVLWVLSIYLLISTFFM